MLNKLNSNNCVILFAKSFLCILFFLATNAKAEEWKNCNVVDSTATQKDAAIALGKIDKRFSFFKKQDYAHIALFFNGEPWRSADLIPTGRNFFADGKPFLGYADKTNSLIVQEFEGSDLMIVSMRGEVDFALYGKCR